MFDQVVGELSIAYLNAVARSIFHLLSKCSGLLQRDFCLIVIPILFVKSIKLKMQTSIIIGRQSRLQLLYGGMQISLRSVDFA
jgi:hypothetical protein